MAIRTIFARREPEVVILESHFFYQFAKGKKSDKAEVATLQQWLASS